MYCTSCDDVHYMASPSTLSQFYMKMDHMDEVGNLHNMNNNVDEIGKAYPTNGHIYG